MSGSAVRAALEAAERAAAPADPRLVAVELDRLLELFGTPANWAQVEEFYFEAFADVPGDIVVLAFRRWRGQPKPFLAKPGELRALVADELAERFAARNKLRFAATRVGPQEDAAASPRRKPSEEDRRYVDAAMARLRFGLPGAAAVAETKPDKSWTGEEMAAARRALGIEPAAEAAA